MTAPTARCSVALIGPYPPPYGGVSVHLQRLFFGLKQAGWRPKAYCQSLPAKSAEPDLFPIKNLSWRRWFLSHGWRLREEIVHCHQVWDWSLALVIAGWMRKKLVVTVHDQMTAAKYGAAARENRIAFRCLLRVRNVQWIAVSANVLGQLVDLGGDESRIRVIPAYLPPLAAHPSEDHLPEPLQKFVDAHQPVMTVYGWRLWLDPHGEDVYGFDLCVEMIRRLKEDYPRIGLVVLLPIIGDEQAYFESLERLAAREQSIGHVFFHTEPLPDPAPLWARSSLFLRPTTTDGDAVSVREALALRVPVIASDCSPRPAGTLTFPTRDIDAFTQQARLVLADREHYARQLEHIHIEDNFASILAIYRELLS